MEEDIVLVTIQYRLNIFGYMSTEDATTPGNYGSLDQVEALKWIQENIAAYGGDPDKVPLTYRDPPNVPCSAERSGEGSVIFREFSVPLIKGGTGKVWRTFIFCIFQLFYNYPSLKDI